jgi:hypothetical protein
MNHHPGKNVSFCLSKVTATKDFRAFLHCFPFSTVAYTPSAVNSGHNWPHVANTPHSKPVLISVFIRQPCVFARSARNDLPRLSVFNTCAYPNCALDPKTSILELWHKHGLRASSYDQEGGI